MWATCDSWRESRVSPASDTRTLEGCASLERSVGTRPSNWPWADWKDIVSSFHLICSYYVRVLYCLGWCMSTQLIVGCPAMQQVHHCP